MSSVFIDTSALLPILDSDDADHQAVLEELKALVAQRTKLVTTSYVIVETGALVLKRLGIEAFKALGRASREAIDVLWIDEPVHRDAWNRVCEGGRKGPGIVDWTSFLTMRELQIDVALALDGHFAAQGFKTRP